jgi:uncharacterized protein (TIGR02118 family)
MVGGDPGKRHQGGDAMVKVTVLYDEPENRAAFEEYYNETHIPKHGQQIPNVIKLEANKAVGDDAPFYRSADLYFEDMASFQASMGSPITQAAIADLENFAKGRHKVLITEVQPVKSLATTKV